MHENIGALRQFLLIAKTNGAFELHGPRSGHFPFAPFSLQSCAYCKK